MRQVFTALALLPLAAAAAAVESEVNPEFAITPQAGPWTICAASFTGDSAGRWAHDLAAELRGRYRLPAYVFNRGADLRRQQEEELQRKRQQQEEYLARMGLRPDMPLRLPRVRVEDQYAVLIGGFADIDAARRELPRVKRLQAPQSVPAAVIAAGVLVPVSATGEAGKDNPAEHPFVASFVARNPTMPVAHDQDKKPDPFWKELNAGETYSLFKCKKPWTLAIKEYQANAVVQPQSAPSNFLDKLFGRSLGEQLSADAMNAHQFAEALRKVGFEAYVLHTRTSSVVTVGGFDSPDDPKLASAKRDLKSIRLTHIDTFPEPMPMAVPRFDGDGR